MLWQLLLAHFLADYPLQPRWMLAAKQRPWGVLLHVSIHFLTSLLLVGDLRWRLVLPLLGLALVHFVIDFSKYRLAVLRPTWVRWPYFIDQALHVLTILGTARWIAAVAGPVAPVQPWVIYLLGYVLATHVWFVSERVLTWHAKLSLEQLETTLWPRMLARALMLTSLLLLFIRPNRLALAAVAWIPYRREEGGLRALLTDLTVAAAAALLVRWALLVR